MKERVEAWCTRYAEAFERGDAEELATFFDLPLAIVTGARTSLFSERVTFERGLVTLLAQYRRAGFSTVRFEVLEAWELAAGMCLGRVQWLLRDVVERPLWPAFEVTYTLRRGGAGDRVCNVVNPFGR